MKGYYSKKLQKHSKLYLELQENIQLYYQHSLEKEQKQKSYLKRHKFINTSKKETLSIDYDFEKKYKEYSSITAQRALTIQELSRNKECSVFLTLTLPSAYHPFKSVATPKGRLYVEDNKDFAFSSIKEAVSCGYKELNHIYQIFYKRVKNYVKSDLNYIRVFECHSTMIPHIHVVLYFPVDKLDFVESVFKRVVEHFKLDRTDLEEVAFKDNINYASKYLLKYIIKDLNNGSDIFKARVLDGWKRYHKIRVLNTSLLPLNVMMYKKIYNSVSFIEENKIFSKKNYKLLNVKEIIDEKVRTQGIPIYYFFQQNLYLEQKIFSADGKCFKQKTNRFGDIKSLFKIKLDIERNRNNKGRLTYKIKKLIISYRGIEIYQNSKYLIIKDYIGEKQL